MRESKMSLRAVRSDVTR